MFSKKTPPPPENLRHPRSRTETLSDEPKINLTQGTTRPEEREPQTGPLRASRRKVRVQAQG